MTTWKRPLVAISAGILFACIGAGPAWAAGDSNLDHYIVNQPIPGWSAESAASLASTVSSLSEMENAAVGHAGRKATVAVERWDNPTSGSGPLLILLVAFSVSGSSSTVDSGATHGAAVAAETFCEGSVGKPPATDVPVASIPNSHFATCPPSSNGTTTEAVTFARANVIALVGGSSGPDVPITAIAAAQFRQLQTSDVAVASGTDAALLWIAGGSGLAVIIAVVVMLQLTSRSRRKDESATGPLIFGGQPAYQPAYQPVAQPGAPGAFPAGTTWDPASNPGRADS